MLLLMVAGAIGLHRLGRRLTPAWRSPVAAMGLALGLVCTLVFVVNQSRTIQLKFGTTWQVRDLINDLPGANLVFNYGMFPKSRSIRHYAALNPAGLQSRNLVLQTHPHEQPGAAACFPDRRAWVLKNAPVPSLVPMNRALGRQSRLPVQGYHQTGSMDDEWGTCQVIEQHHQAGFMFSGMVRGMSFCARSRLNRRSR